MNSRILLLFLSLASLHACSSEPSGRDTYLNNPDDHSYANRKAKDYPNAAGGTLHFSDFSGDFVWVDFAAPWCPPCAPQAQVIKQLEFKTPGVAFVTLMTSDQEPHSPATNQTVSSWATRFLLDPHNVAICTETRVVPTHMLFSPRGQLLYWREGGLSLQQIQEVLAIEVPKWNGQSGQIAR